MKTTGNRFRATRGAGLKVAAGLPLLMGLGAPVMAQDVSELERRLEALQAEVAALKSEKADSKSDSAKDSPYVLRDGAGFKIGDTTLTFGGFVKADIVAGSNGDGSKNNYVLGQPRNFAALARNGKKDWGVGFSARETRLSFGTATANMGGDTLRTYVEMDFNQGADDGGNEFVSNSYQPRLRQAFGSWKGWTIGQTYSTFTDLSVMPEILNQGKQAAFMHVRQPLVRYTMAAPGGSLMMALENPEDGGNDQSIPDVALRYNLKTGHGHYSLALLGRQLETDEDKKVAGAVSVSALIKTFGKDDLRLQYSYGAIGRYMGLYAYPDVNASPADEVEEFNAQGLTAAYRHHWSSSLRSNLVLSHTEAVDDAFAAPGTRGDLDSATSTQVNLLWQAAPKVTYGIEYAYWDFDHAQIKGSDQYQQVMLSAKFDF